MRALPSSLWSTVLVSLLLLAHMSTAPARASDAVTHGLGGGSPTVPVLFIPGYAASSPSQGTVRSFTFRRGARPQTLNLSPSYDLLVRSFRNAGYRKGKTFFGAVYDWRMAAAPDDGLFDGALQWVTAPAITRQTYEYAINYLGYWLDRAVQANPGLEYVDVVTHSTGGILARAYVQSPAYGGAYVDEHGISHHLPKIRYLILGAAPNEGTIHSWRPWHADFQDVLSGFIPTTEIEARFLAASFAFVSAGGKVTGPDYDITRSLILKLDQNERFIPDPATFFRLYDPMRQRLMPTSDFLTPPGGNVATNVNSDPSLRSDVLLDLNALSTPGNNPWVSRVGVPGGQGGVIPTFASGAREKMSVKDFIVRGQVNGNPFICTAVAIEQFGNGQGYFLPLLDLLKRNPTVVPVSQSLFPRVGDDELKLQLSGDGNAFLDSYLSTFAGDPHVELVTWGNGLPPSNPPTNGTCLAPSSVPNWNRHTDYPVYHDVFFYNPDVRNFVVSTLTGKTPRAEAVIKTSELATLLKFLNGR